MSGQAGDDRDRLSVYGEKVDLDLGGPWRAAARGPVEVICHNDFAPHNLVFNDAGRAVGAIDWDFASPGSRLWDLPTSDRPAIDG